MAGESILSIELAIGAATLVLGLRLFSLIQATRGVRAAHEQLVEAISAGDFKRLQKKARGLGYRNPYGEVASELIEASRNERGEFEPTTALVTKATQTVRRRLIRRTHQGQAADLVALAVALGIALFAREGLPAGPIFWSLGGALTILLLSSLVARDQLKASVLGSLDALGSTLQNRPQLPTLSDGPVDCFWCGAETTQKYFEIRATSDSKPERVEGTICLECGKLVATLKVCPPPVSSQEETPDSND